MSLPSGYTQVHYIQSAGQSFIDAGLVVNKDDSFEYVITALFTNNAYGGANGYLQFQSGIAADKKAEIKVVYDGTTHVESIYVDNVLNSTMDWTSQYDGANVKVGVLRMGNPNNSWYTGDNQTGKIYSLKIKKNGELVRDFVPCANASGVLGLYDKVGGTFYTSAGNAAFFCEPMQCLQLTRGDAATGVTVELSGDFSYGSVTVDGTTYKTEKTLKLHRGTSVKVTVTYTGSQGVMFSSITLNGTSVGTSTSTGIGGSKKYSFEVTDNCTIVFGKGTYSSSVQYGTATITMPA